MLDNVGLAAALEWALASAVAHLPPEKKFEYEVIAGEEIEERIKLEPGERIQIYRIAQEIINNICRHSQARHVRLALETLDPNNLTLTIEDDGQFFAPNRWPGSGTRPGEYSRPRQFDRGGSVLEQTRAGRHGLYSDKERTTGGYRCLEYRLKSGFIR